MLCKELAGGTNAGHVYTLAPSRTCTHRTSNMQHEIKMKYLSSLRHCSFTLQTLPVNTPAARGSLPSGKAKSDWTNVLAAWRRSAPATSQHPACWGPLVSWNLCFALRHFLFSSVKFPSVSLHCHTPREQHATYLSQRYTFYKKECR